MRLVRRVARHHAPRTDIARERLSQLRRMWALWLAGGGVGFLGLAFVLTSIHHWLINPERNLTLALIPIGLTSILLGLALLVVTTAIYVLGRNRMRTSSGGLSSAPGRRLRSVATGKQRCAQLLDCEPRSALPGDRWRAVMTVRPRNFHGCNPR